MIKIWLRTRIARLALVLPIILMSCSSNTYIRVLPHDEGIGIPNYDSNQTYVRIFERPSLHLAWKVIEVSKDNNGYTTRFLMVPAVDSLKPTTLPIKVAEPESLYLKARSIVKNTEKMNVNNLSADDGYELKIEIVDPGWRVVVNCDIYRYASCMELFKIIKSVYQNNIDNKQEISQLLNNAGYMAPTFDDWFTEIRDGR